MISRPQLVSRRTGPAGSLAVGGSTLRRIGEKLKQRARTVVEQRRLSLLQLSHDLASNPELSFREVRSARRIRDELSSFDLVDVPGLPTAFVASTGSGSLNIGICAEYDALPVVGHACGHNVVAASAVGAALALAEMSDEIGIRVTVVGTPAEEDGGGKILLLRAGAFDGMHAAMMVHPHVMERDAMATLALAEFRFDFTPVDDDDGDAVAAVALMQAAVGLTREQLRSTERVHGIALPDGEPRRASTMWTVRAAHVPRLGELKERLFAQARGAATMSRCDLSIEKQSPLYADLRTDERLAAKWRLNAGLLGRESLSVQPGDQAASTDMGNVSYAMPAMHPLLRIDAGSATIHQPGFAHAAVSKAGDDAVFDGAVIMAWTIIDMAVDSSLRKKLERQAFRVATAGRAAYLDHD